MLTGTIRHWDQDKGQGIIEADGEGGDVMVHFSAIVEDTRDHLPVGTRVEFELGVNEASGKSEAKNVRAIGPS